MDVISEVNGQADSGQVAHDERDAQKGKYMTFKSGNEYYGLKIQYVSEIIQFQAITAIPETADYIKGLINLRGKIIPVIDISIRFKQEPVEYNDRTCIMVVNVQNTLVGLIIEKIAEVVTSATVVEPCAVFSAAATTNGMNRPMPNADRVLPR